MTLPAALTLIPLHGRILKADSTGTPAAGTVSFRIEQTLRDTTDNVLLAPTTLTATLDATGAFTVSLPATDDPDVTPQGWTYVVTISTDAIRDSWRIAVPAATVGTLELADIAPAVTPPALVTYVLASTVGQVGGPAGPLDSNSLVPAVQVPGAGGSEFTPADHGLLGWAFDVSTTLAGSAILTGQVVLIAVKIAKAATVGTLHVDLTSGGSVLSNCAAGLYDSAGVLRGSTADQSTSWQSGGLKSMSLLVPYAALAGRYWVGLLVGQGSTTPPNVGRASSQIGMPNLNLTAANIRYGVAPGSALTALPASFTPSGIGVQNAAWWAAVS